MALAKESHATTKIQMTKVTMVAPRLRGKRTQLHGPCMLGLEVQFVERWFRSRSLCVYFYNGKDGVDLFREELQNIGLMYGQKYEQPTKSRTDWNLL